MKLLSRKVTISHADGSRRELGLSVVELSPYFEGDNINFNLSTCRNPLRLINIKPYIEEAANITYIDSNILLQQDSEHSDKWWIQ